MKRQMVKSNSYFFFNSILDFYPFIKPYSNTIRRNVYLRKWNSRDLPGPTILRWLKEYNMARFYYFMFNDLWSSPSQSNSYLSTIILQWLTGLGLLCKAYLFQTAFRVGNTWKNESDDGNNRLWRAKKVTEPLRENVEKLSTAHTHTQKNNYIEEKMISICCVAANKKV